jgi:hypothetical protein
MWWWRVTLTWQSGQYSPTGAQVQVLDVTRVARLRDMVLAARRDPRIRGYRYWLHRQWDEADAPRRCPRGHELTPGRAGGRPCRCGSGITSRTASAGRCGICRRRDRSCGELPFDPEAGRHHW